MEILTAGVVGATVASSFLYAIWPLVKPPEDVDGILPDSNGRESREHEISRLLLERDQAYKSIMDIEFDQQMGKLSEEDFAQMMEAARAHALEVLRKLEARGVEEGAVSVQLDEREASRAAEQLVSTAEIVGEEEGEEEAPLSAPSLDDRLEEEILAHRKVKPSPAAPKPKRAAAAAPPSAAGASSAVRFCPSCGAKAGENHNFCAACGFKLR